MTKEELEKEAVEIYQKTDKEFIDCQDEGEVFNIGYILGAEPREKRIAELEARCNELFFQVNEKTERIAELEATNKKISDECHKLVNSLEKEQNENAKLKSECRSCVYTDSPCILSDYGKDRNGICDHFKDVFDENTKLRTKLEALEGQTPWKDIKYKSEVIKENAELKEEIDNLKMNKKH